MWTYTTQTGIWDKLYESVPSPVYDYNAPDCGPGWRVNASIWVASEGALWLYGGEATVGNYNFVMGDMWRFSIGDVKWNAIINTTEPSYGGT